jgi:serine/threonine protein kinase
MHILTEMCSGVQAIHDAGIVHRDLKPENILLTKEGDVKIADFGIARTGHGPKLTEHGGVVGTIDYVSPEYMLNSQVDWRSDIYAIGILGYEMVAGESPFRGDSVYATMTKRLKSDAKPPSALRPECSPALDRIILRAMHRDPEQRYQSAIEMFYDLQDLLPDEEKSSGGYNRGGNRKSGVFTGPVLETGTNVDSHSTWTDAHDALTSAPTSTDILKKPVPSVAARPAVRRDPPATVLPNMSPRREDNFEPFTEEVGDVDFGPGSTLELSSSHETFREDDTIQEPIRMERMLAYNDLVSQGWGTPSVPSEIRITGTGIDENRLRRLSHQAGQNSRLGWTDAAYIVGAIILGLGLGFTILMKVWPEQMGHEPAPKENIDLHAVDGG